MLGPQRLAGRAFLFGESDGLPGQAAQPVGVAIRKVEPDRDPLPALRAQGLGLGLQLLVRQPVEQRRVLQPAAIVVLEQVAQHDAAGRLIGRDADELRPPVAGADCAFGQLAADEVGRLVVAEGAPDLLLPGMVVGHRERHQLLQRHAVLGVDIEQLFRDGRELQPLLDAGRADEEPRRDLLLAEPLGAQRLEGAELVERMQRLALAVLGERVLLGQPIGAHHARHRLASSPSASA